MQHLCSECSQAKGEVPHGADHTVYKIQFRGSSSMPFQNEGIDRENTFGETAYFCGQEAQIWSWSFTKHVYQSCVPLFPQNSVENHIYVWKGWLKLVHLGWRLNQWYWEKCFTSPFPICFYKVPVKCCPMCHSHSVYLRPSTQFLELSGELISSPFSPFLQLLQLLESETMQLEAFLEWKQLEPVYWQWMVTNPTDLEGCIFLDFNIASKERPLSPTKLNITNRLFKKEKKVSVK